MKTHTSILFFALALLVSTVSGFGVATTAPLASGALGGSSFVVSHGRQAPVAPKARRTTRGSDLQMGKQAKFGIFSPAVYVARIALGSDKLNKLRGKAISLHSQAIGDFCTWVGAYHLRTQLIKKAKTNGDILGFLV